MLSVGKFVDDVGGGERTRRSILSEIRNAANSEETLDGKRNAIKQIIFNKAAELTANFYGKTAGILTPIVGLSGTARQLQKKLHHEFGTEYKFREGQKEIIQKDLFEEDDKLRRSDVRVPVNVSLRETETHVYLQQENVEVEARSHLGSDTTSLLDFGREVSLRRSLSMS